MPELPAMENFRLLIEEEALGRTIETIVVGKGRVVVDSLPKLNKAFAGKALKATRRYGKYVFVAADDKGGGESWLSFHCGLTGYFEVGGTDVAKAKLLFRFADGGSLAFFDPRMFGRVALIDSPDDFIAAQKLGPDAGAIPKAEFIAALQASGQPLKGFFLDQSILAGIGNVYADEILFRSRIDPRRKAKTLDRAAGGRLFTAMGTVLKIATARKASLDNWDMLPAAWLARHRAVGAACPRCGGPIADDTIAGRHGYFCPNCQTG